MHPKRSLQMASKTAKSIQKSQFSPQISPKLHRTTNARCKQTEPAGKGMRPLRTALRLAQEMGARLGRSEVLQRPLPGEKN
jgi:hypothetical protein